MKHISKKRMQKLAGLLQENQENQENQKITTLKALEELLSSLVNEYIGETDNILAGDTLDWDGDGTNIGMYKKEAIQDFVNYLTQMELN